MTSAALSITAEHAPHRERSGLRAEARSVGPYPRDQRCPVLTQTGFRQQPAFQ
jgi:hypothetical protein